MNYLPTAGYWFYVGVGAGNIQSFYDSYGLLGEAPAITVSRGLSILGSLWTSIMGG